MAYQEIALRLTSTDTFDLNDSSLTVQIGAEDGFGLPSLTIDNGITQATFRTYYEGIGSNGLYVEYTDSSGNTTSDYILDPPDGYMFFRISLLGSNLIWSTSLDGSSFTTHKTQSVSSDEALYFRSSRIRAGNNTGSWGVPTFTHIGSINPVLSASNNSNFLAFFYP